MISSAADPSDAVILSGVVPRPRRILLLLVTTLLWYAVLPVPTTFATPDTGPSASLVLESLTPATITPSATVRVTGRIINTGSTALSGLRATLLSHYAPLTTRSQVTAWMDTPQSPVNAPERAAVNVPETVAPQQSVPFTLTLPAGNLGLADTARSFGARGAGIEIWAGPRDDRTRLTVQRTFLIWTPEVSYSPTQLTLLTPVTSTIPQADAARPDTALLTSMDADGRLDNLLRATSDPAIAWMLDPSLLAAAQETATGTQLENTASATTTPSTAEGSTATGAGGTVSTSPTTASPPSRTTSTGDLPETAAPSAETSPSTSVTQTATPEQVTATAQWLNRLTEGLVGREATALPFGDSDVVSLAHARTPGLLTLADKLSAETTEQILGQRLRSDVALPADGMADPDALLMLSDTGSTSVVLSASNQPPRENLTYTPSGRSTLSVDGGSPLRGLLYDPTLSTEFAATGSDSAVVATQRLVADLATLTAEHPNDARSVLIVTPRDWTPDPAGVVPAMATLRSISPWLRLVPLSSLESAPVPEIDRTQPQYPARARTAELPPSAITPLVTILDELNRFAPALTEPEQVIPSTNRTAALLTSIRWRDEPEKQTESRKGFANRVRALYDGVKVLPSGPKILVSRSLSPLLVTLENQLDQPVHVILQLRPRNGRLQIPHTVGVTLDAHRRQTVRVRVRAVANGEVPVEAILLTPQGEALSTAGPITVYVHSDWENRALTGTGGVLLLLVVVGLIRGIRRGRVRVSPEEVPDPDEEVVLRESRPQHPHPENAPEEPTVTEDKPDPGPGPGPGPDDTEPTTEDEPDPGDEKGTAPS